MAHVLTLAHLSDPHLSSLKNVDLRSLLNKRLLGYISWRLHRNAEHRPEVLTALQRDLDLTRPDHIAITGDLTHVGLPGEFLEAQRWLASLGSPSKVTVIPGNHDAYVSTRWSETLACWHQHMTSDGVPFKIEKDGEAFFPTLRTRDDVALIGVSSAHPTLPFLATGKVGARQLHRLAELLDQCGRRGLFRLLLIHHPPLPSTTSWRKRLTDNEALRTMLARHGVELILHGHTHRSSLDYLKLGDRTIPVVGTPSASAIGSKRASPAAYGLYHVQRVKDGWNVLLVKRQYIGDDGRFVQGECIALCDPASRPAT